MQLGEVLAGIEKFRVEDTIFSRRPWRLEEEAILVQLDEEGGIPESVKESGWDYFLEIDGAHEVLEVFGERVPTPEECQNVLLYYGEYDAFPNWVYEDVMPGRDFYAERRTEWRMIQQEIAKGSPHYEAAALQIERDFYDQLGPELFGETCNASDCGRDRIHYSVLCKVHHYEQIRKKVCPFSD